MGSFRFRRSVKITPGLKINLNKKSTSVTVGGKGFHHTVSSNGKKTTSVGIPGTGLSYVDVQSSKKSKKHNNAGDFSEENVVHDSSPQTDNPIIEQRNPLLQRVWFQLLMLFTFTPLGIFCIWFYKEWKAPVKVILSIIFILYFTFVGAFCGV